MGFALFTSLQRFFALSNVLQPALYQPSLLFRIDSAMNYRRTNSNLKTLVTEQRQSGFDDESCTKKERLPRCHQYVMDPNTQ